MTFFDFAGLQKATFGTNEISRTTFRVPTLASFDYWRARFTQFGIRYDDPEIGIDWGIDKPILSEKDTKNPFLKDIEEELNF